MKQQLWFTTDQFPVEPGEDQETNPGRFGRTFANWLASQLREKSLPVEGVIPEDLGWCVVLTRDPCLVWVGCGNEDESATRWGAFLEIEPSFFQKLFGNVNCDALWSQYWPRIEEVLRKAPGARDFDVEDRS